MSVFVMMPFSSESQAIYDSVIRPVVEQHNLECILAVDQNSLGPIPQDIADSIESSRFCLADLTGSNPNVLYEVGLAHRSRKPVIFLTQGEITDIPFDIRHHRAIKYTASGDGQQALAGRLNEILKGLLASDESDMQLLKKALAPKSIESGNPRFAVVANPLSYRAAFRSRGGYRSNLVTYSDHVGIRGLMQSFGLIYGLERLPELLNPDDFDDKILDEPGIQMNLYAIGSSKTNRWTGMLMDRFFGNRQSVEWDFKPDPNSREIWNPRVMLCRGGERYTPIIAPIGTRQNEWDFGLVLRGPNPVDPRCMFMALAGRGALGTEATCLAVTDPSCLRILKQRLDSDGDQCDGDQFDLDNHQHAFCAVVGIGADADFRADKKQFKVCEVVRC